jgi:uncharacterized protein
MNPPIMEGFRPFGIPIKDLEPVILLFEEYEAIRLADYEGMNQEQAAEQMNVSRPTFTRIYEKARKSVAKAFVEGKAIIIDGGNYHSNEFWYRCDCCLKLNICEKEIEYCIYCRSEEIRRLDQKPNNNETR